MSTRSNRLGKAVLTSTHNLCFEPKMKNIRIFIWKLLVFGGEIFNIFEYACFRNAKHQKKERWGTNNHRTNAIYENTDARTKNCSRGFALGLLWKERICSPWQHFFPFKLDFFYFQKGSITCTFANNVEPDWTPQNAVSDQSALFAMA